MQVSRLKVILLGLMLQSQTVVQASQGLSLQQAELIAVQRDALSKSYEKKAQAYSEQAIASEAWPDPRLKFGAQAVPIDSFDLEQEPMTQVILGYQQMLPRGDSNELSFAAINAMSRMQTAKSQRREREVLMKVRQAWLDVLLQERSIRIIQANRHLFVKMLEISESFYASGRQQQQDVVQAQLEISLVDDRLEQAHSKLIVSRASLAKWVGEDNLQNGLDDGQLNMSEHDLPNMQLIEATLEKNPEFIAATEKIISQQKKLSIADEQYDPQWGFDVNYGRRSGENPDGSDRADFLTAMVTLDLPIFTENKQDRTLSAEKQRLQATRYEQLDIKRELSKRLKNVMGRLQKLKDRQQLHKDKILPQAKQNAEVSLRGYQSGVVSFFTLTRARVTELNTRLSNLRINVAYKKAHAELQYLIGEKS